MITQVTARNTKAQILTAFEELSTAYRDMEKRAKAAEKRAKSSPKASSPVVVEDDGEVNIATILGQLDQLRLHFRTAASEISGDLIMEATRLHGVREEIGERLSQLQMLHSISVDGDPLDVTTSLLEKYAAQSSAFEAAHEKRVTSFTAEMTEKRETWRREREEHVRLVKVRDLERKKGVQRDKAAYEYELRRTRQLTQEEQEQAEKARQKGLDAKISEQERVWESTERKIADQEASHAEARQVAEGLDARLEKARKQATEEGAAIARRQARVRAERLAKQVDGEKRVFELQIANLGERISDQQARVQALNAQIAATLDQAQALAVKAIEGSELTSSFETLKRIALEQARGTQKGK